LVLVKTASGNNPEYFWNISVGCSHRRMTWKLWLRFLELKLVWLASGESVGFK